MKTTSYILLLMISLMAPGFADINNENFFIKSKIQEINRLPSFINEDSATHINEDSATHVWKIKSNLPQEAYGKAHGLVYQSPPHASNDTFGLFIKDTTYLNQFDVILVSQKPPNKKIQLLVRTTPIIKDWKYVKWKLPTDLQNKDLILKIYHVRPLDPEIQFTFSDPIQSSSHTSLQIWKWVQCLLTLVLTSMLFILPAHCLLKHLSFFHNKVGLFRFPIIVLTSLCISYIGFWIYWLHPILGTFFSLTLIIWTLLVIGKSPRILEFYIHEKEVRIPLLLWLISVLTSLSSGYLHDGWEQPAHTPQIRYLEAALPNDNLLPLFFEERIEKGHPIRPFSDIWLTSDRPPLQTAVFLFQSPLVISQELHYQILSMLLQSLIIPLSYLCLRIFNLSRKASIIISINLLFSGTFLLHSFYAWPKLLPASMLILATGILFQNQTELIKNQWQKGLLLGLLSSLSMLSHGGSLIALIPLFTWALAARRFIDIKLIISTVSSFLLLMLPWSFYQKEIDPPGNQLVKWHVAGFAGEKTDLNTVQLLIHQYQQLSWSQWLYNKWTNFEMIMSEWSISLMQLYPQQISDGFPLLRNGMFSGLLISILPTLGITICYPMLIKKRKNLKSLAHLIPILLCSILFWVILLFGPSATSLHQGTYYIPFLLSLLLLSFAHIASSLFLKIWTVINLLSTSIIWVIPFPQMGGTDSWILSKQSFNPISLAIYIAILTLCIFYVFINDFKRRKQTP